MQRRLVFVGLFRYICLTISLQDAFCARQVKRSSTSKLKRSNCNSRFGLIGEIDQWRDIRYVISA